MPLQDDVRDLIGDLYDSIVTPRQFREKFAPMFSESSRYISDIHEQFIEIDSIYAQYMLGRLDEAELKKQLFEFLPSTRVQVPEISNSAELWSLPITTTKNNSPRMTVGKSTRTNPQLAEIILHR
jgi:hypothetical protein